MSDQRPSRPFGTAHLAAVAAAALSVTALLSAFDVAAGVAEVTAAVAACTLPAWVAVAVWRPGRHAAQVGSVAAAGMVAALGWWATARVPDALPRVFMTVSASITLAAAVVVAVVALVALFFAPGRRRRDSGFDVGDVVWSQAEFADGSGSKDRPLLVVDVARDGTLTCVHVTSKDRVLRYPGTMSIGKGSWDAQRRESYIDVTKVYERDPAQIRRLGGTLSAYKRAAAVRLWRQHR